jgi:inorganic pyrophosphatase/exopolyphosphatase
MNAEEVINELEKHGGIADKEWHGEKLKSKQNKLHDKKEQEILGIDNSQFDIEESEEGKWINGKDSNIPDALQQLSLIEKPGL